MIIHKKLFFALGSEHHDHLATFKLRLHFDLGFLGKLITDAMHDLCTEILVSHFTTAVAQRDLGLISIGQETAKRTQLGLIVIFVSGRTELNFLDLNNLLTSLHFLGLLLLLIAELAVIHQAANRRLGIRRDLNEINVVVLSHAKSFGCRNNTDLGAIDAGQSDLRYPNLTIDSVVAILCYGTSPKISSHD